MIKSTLHLNGTAIPDEIQIIALVFLAPRSCLFDKVRMCRKADSACRFEGVESGASFFFLPAESPFFLRYHHVYLLGLTSWLSNFVY